MKKLFLFTLLSLASFFFVACGDDDDDYRANISAPSTTVLTDAIKGYINENYPNSTIVDSEVDANGVIDVDIVHDSKSKDVYFSSSGEWLYTEWDITVDELPQDAKNVILTAYPDYLIDDVEYIQSPQGVYYDVNIEKGNFEKDIRVTADGNIIEVR